MPACQRSQIHYIYISWQSEGLSLGVTLTTLPARTHTPLWHVTGNVHGKAVEHQHACLSEVTGAPQLHFLAVGGALLGGIADHAAGADSHTALACHRQRTWESSGAPACLLVKGHSSTTITVSGSRRGFLQGHC